jgi:hypothetical protein
MAGRLIGQQLVRDNLTHRDMQPGAGRLAVDGHLFIAAERVAEFRVLRPDQERQSSSAGFSSSRSSPWWVPCPGGIAHDRRSPRAGSSNQQSVGSPTSAINSFRGRGTKPGGRLWLPAGRRTGSRPRPRAGVLGFADPSHDCPGLSRAMSPDKRMNWCIPLRGRDPAMPRRAGDPLEEPRWLARPAGAQPSRSLRPHSVLA